MSNSATAVADPVGRSEAAVPGRYRHDWELFADWCAATDRTALPADPDTVIAFLDAHPAARTTNRRRLTAIRWTHRHARALVPHRTTELRTRIGPASNTRIDTDTIRPLLEQMPTSGWTAGLVGRRDALLLVLTAHGVPYTAMERLRRRDVAVDDNRCLVVTLPTTVVRIPAAPDDPRTCPVAVYLRWTRLLAYHDRYPSSIALAEALRAAPPISAESVERYQSLPTPPRAGRDPLLLTINRWGQFGAPCGGRGQGAGMCGDSISGDVDAHLEGTVRFRELSGQPDKRPTTGDGDPRANMKLRADRDALRRHRAPDGLLRRRRVLHELADLDDAFAEIEQRSADLTAWIDSILREAH